jgi:hypothetical protein
MKRACLQRKEFSSAKRMKHKKQLRKRWRYGDGMFVDNRGTAVPLLYLALLRASERNCLNNGTACNPLEKTSPQTHFRNTAAEEAES